jgi:bifunctional DNA-binding transcriptional regulator/antitoxin component of YhaV-PrlF toxin-antitoxin module
MQVVIDHGKILIPEKIRKKIGLPSKGNCDLKIIGNILQIIPPSKTDVKKLHIIKHLQTKHQILSTDKIINAGVVDID